MKYLLPAILLIFLLQACKKEHISTSFTSTLDGQTYPPKGFYPNWNNWPNTPSISTIGTDTLLLVSSQWGFTDTNYSANQYTPYARLEFDIRGFGYSLFPGSTIDQKYLSIIAPGSLDFCSNNSNNTRCASIRMLDNNGNTLSSTDLGDNSSSTFTITGVHTQGSSGNMLVASFTANFKCKLYTATDSAQTFSGTCTCIAGY